ncbi:MAG: LLM class flavin-dependent oxidoreductase [Chloroflexi bacterium]|nr:MAG: LLM class flavin-dependent oxidoreductase [Chloroflexota bacterium]
MGRGFGIAASVAPEVAATVAQEAERLGYTSFWSNDTGGFDGLATLAAAAGATTTLKLGVGVIGVDRRPGNSIADDVARLGLPLERLWLGVGSGGSRSLAIVRQAVDDLHQRGITTAFIAALGPNMNRLAGEVAEGVLFNWLTPEFAERSRGWVLEAAERVGRPHPIISAYVRCALLPQADAQLDRQAALYSSFPSYADHFTRMGVSARNTCVHGPDAATLQAGIARHEAVLDETVVRAITADESAESILELLHACAP